jgi:hypothetical protein
MTDWLRTLEKTRDWLTDELTDVKLRLADNPSHFDFQILNLQHAEIMHRIAHNEREFKRLNKK